VVDQKLPITLKTDPSFKDVIHAFSLMVQMVGDGTEAAKANRTVRIPGGLPGGGLPPVGTP